MKQLFVFTLLFGTITTQAWALCKLNHLGHNICTNEKALIELPGLIDDTNVAPIKKFVPVFVKSFIPNSRMAVIEGNKPIGEKEVHIDELVGNRLCEDNNGEPCKGDKVIIRHDCQDPNYKSKYKVSENYENDVVELTTGSFLFGKKFLISNNCIDAAK